MLLLVTVEVLEIEVIESELKMVTLIMMLFMHIIYLHQEQVVLMVPQKEDTLQDHP